MRADRLVSALLVLQARGKITAAELASELEVSTRTARRDLEALAMAGIPVYPQPGRGGGWSLLGGARTDLTGFTAPEAHALFLAVGASSTASPSLGSAMAKLAQALPETFRAEAALAESAIIVDPTAWGRASSPTPPEFVELLQDAVVHGQKVRLGYAGSDKAPSVRDIHPLGLITKAGVWYLIATADASPRSSGGQRTFRISRVTSATMLAEPLTRPPGFDLETAWTDVTETIQIQRHSFTVQAAGMAWTLGPLRHVLGRRLHVGDTRTDGLNLLSIQAQDPTITARELVGFGAGLEVLSPASVRQEMAAIAAELSSLYGSAPDRK